MRVSEELKKIGYFWLPSDPENKVPGTLIITDGGKIELEVIGQLYSKNNGVKKPFNTFGNKARIVGYIEKHGLVTLDDCFCINRKISFPSIYRSTIHVGIAYLGIEYTENEKILFNHFKFSVEGIDEWVGISGLNTKFQQETHSATISYIPPKEINLHLINGMELQIKFDWTVTGLQNQKEASIRQKTFFKLSSKQELALDDFISAANRITTLLSFAIDNTVSIEEVTAASEKLRKEIGYGKNVLIPISIYYSSIIFVDNRPKINKYAMLFGFEQIQKDAERIVNRWFEVYNEIDPVLNLYFSSKAGAHKYLEGKFMALAQTLEAYHRRTTDMKLMGEDEFEKLKASLINQCPDKHRDWLKGRIYHGNEVNLSHRIKKIIEPFKSYFGDKEQRKGFVRSIVDTRNYLTHYDESLASKVAKNMDLLNLNLKMEAVFQLQLLKKLGFTQEEINSILENSSAIKQKLGLN